VSGAFEGVDGGWESRDTSQRREGGSGISKRNANWGKPLVPDVVRALAHLFSLHGGK